VKPINKEFSRRVFGFFGLYLVGAVLGCSALTKDLTIVLLFLYLCLPFIILVPFSRFNVNTYLISITYLFTLGFVCLLSTVTFTLLPPENAMHYFGLPVPDNYIALAFCTVPFIALFIHMVHKGCKSKQDIEKAYVKDCKKINLETGEYYINQGINIFNGVTRVRMKDMWLNKFFENHINIVYWVLVTTSGLGPAIPVLISRNAGQQPLNYFLLICISYFALLCAYLIPINFHLIRTVLYIQKKHNIKLKLAYKNDDDVIIV
jgi:hypothetical protein